MANYNRPRTMTISEEEAEFRRALEKVPPPTPPDGGWGWIVVISAFLINAIVDGISYSFGLMVPELRDHFLEKDLSKNSYPTAIIFLAGALLLGLYMTTGPVASAICNKLNSRTVAMLSSVFAMISLGVCIIFAHKTYVFILFFAFTGIMFGMMFLSSILIVGFYFEKHRVIATTITMCGSGVGTAVMAPLTTIMFQEYGWKHAFALIAGLVLQGCVLGALYRPLDADLRRRKKLILKRLEEDNKIGPQTCIVMQRLLEEKRRQRTYSTGSMNGVIITRDNRFVRVTDLPQHKPTLLNRIKGAITSRSKLSLASRSQASSGPPSRISTPGTVHRGLPLLQMDNDSPWGTPSTSRRQTFGHAPSPLVAPDARSAKSLQIQGCVTPTSIEATPVRRYASAQEMGNDTDSIAMSHTSETSVEPELIRTYRIRTPDQDRPMYRKDILLKGSVQNLPQYNNNIEEYVASITNIPSRAQFETDVHQISCWDRLTCLPTSVTDVLRSVFDASTLKSPTFVRLALASFFTMFGYYIPFIMLPMICTRRVNVVYEPVYCAYLLTILGLANTAGRVIAAVIGGKRRVDCNTVNVLTLLLAGCLTFSLPLLLQRHHEQAYNILCVYSALYGLLIAPFSTLSSVVVVDLLGLDKLTTAYSQLVVINGLAIIISTPIAGLMHDVGNTEDWSFYMAGAAIALSGLLCIGLKESSLRERQPDGYIDPCTPTTTQTSSEEEVKKHTPPEIVVEDESPAIESVL